MLGVKVWFFALVLLLMSKICKCTEWLRMQWSNLWCSHHSRQLCDCYLCAALEIISILEPSLIIKQRYLNWLLTLSSYPQTYLDWNLLVRSLFFVLISIHHIWRIFHPSSSNWWVPLWQLNHHCHSQSKGVVRLQFLMLTVCSGVPHESQSWGIQKVILKECRGQKTALTSTDKESFPYGDMKHYCTL